MKRNLRKALAPKKTSALGVQMQKSIPTYLSRINMMPIPTVLINVIELTDIYHSYSLCKSYKIEKYLAFLHSL